MLPPSPLTGAFGRFPAAARGCGARGAAGRAGPSRGAARSGVPARCGAAKSPPGPGPSPRRAPSCAPAPRIPPAGSPAPGGRGAHGGTPGGTDPPRPSRAAAVGTGAAHSWERDTAKADERAAGGACRHRFGERRPQKPPNWLRGWMDPRDTPVPRGQAAPACVGAALGSQCPESSRLLGAVVAVPVVNGTRRNAAPIPVRAGPAVTSRLQHPGCCRARCQPGSPLKELNLLLKGAPKGRGCSSRTEGRVGKLFSCVHGHPAWPPCPGLVPRLTLRPVCRVPSNLLLAHGSPTHIQGCSSPAGPSNMCFLLPHSLPRLLRLSDAAQGLGFPTGTALMGWELGARNSDYKRAAAGRSQHEQPRCWLPQGRDAGTAEPPGLLLGKPGFGGGWLRGGEASCCSAVRGENQGSWMLGSGGGGTWWG